ncbi:MAG: glycosyl hydrolase [Proteobacteria bacterium]|nr:glycosyl hydrolase [Pseudomonadota bacterium]
MKDKIDKLVMEMTLEEKASLCSGRDFWTTRAVERLGIESMSVSDGPHGLRRSAASDHLGVTESIPATCFPTASALASSWDVEVMDRVGQALGDECQAQDVQVLLGPGVNMKRSPLCGRNFEYYSEDPYLSAELGIAFVNAVQSKGVGTSLKHYACNNQEYERMSMDSLVDERTLREIYLYSFERIVKEARPWTIMCSYNKVNGTLASENAYLLKDILKEDWGFEGLVVSDWCAVSDPVKAVENGLDLEMPGTGQSSPSLLVKAVQDGKLEEARLDEAVRRNLTVLFQALENKGKGAQFDADLHHKLARQVASDCMVLLKNEGAVLPLDKAEIGKLAVVGAFAKTPRFQGSGSSKVNPTRVETAWEALNGLTGETVDLVFAQGYEIDKDPDEKLIGEAAGTAENADAAVVFVGLPDSYESEGFDRTHIDIPESHIQLINAVLKKQKKTIVVLSNGSAISCSSWINDVPAVLEGWLGGQASGGAVADILFGEVNPSGKLAETFPIKLSDNPSHLNFPGENGRLVYGENLFIGYRYYDKKEMDVQFPFGFGLSYTTFEYSDLVVEKEELTDKDTLQVSCKVTNTGKRDGKEIVQLYLRDVESFLIRPEKELKGFRKIHLKPGETTTVVFTLQARDFSYYVPTGKEWVAETGDFEILIGSSSRDIRLSTRCCLQSSRSAKPPLTEDSMFWEFAEDERFVKPLKEYFGPIVFRLLNWRNTKISAILQNSILRKLANLLPGATSDKKVQKYRELVKKIEEIQEGAK